MYMYKIVQAKRKDKCTRASKIPLGCNKNMWTIFRGPCQLITDTVTFFRQVLLYTNFLNYTSSVTYLCVLCTSADFIQTSKNLTSVFYRWSKFYSTARFCDQLQAKETSLTNQSKCYRQSCGTPILQVDDIRER